MARPHPRKRARRRPSSVFAREMDRTFGPGFAAANPGLLAAVARLMMKTKKLTTKK